MSSSKSKQSSSETITDSRIAATDNALAVNSGGGRVTIMDVPDEAFELAEMAVSTVGQTSSDAFDFARANARDAMETVQRMAEMSMSYARSESGQIAEQIIKIGIPAAVLVMIVTKGKLIK